jgi:phosphoglycerol transferase MdoB-like AlkP superfamily enzyme
VDLRSFAGSRTFGPYVSDASVADKIISLVGRSDRPTFVFAITMENHGPLRLETISPGEAALYFDPSRDGGQPAPHDLTVYLRHLSNADRMVGTLRAWMENRSRQGLLCFYGDHVPIMPDVYELGSAQDGSTDYLIWDSRRRGGGRKQDVHVDRLGVLLLEAAGLMCAAPTHPAGVLRASEYSC